MSKNAHIILFWVPRIATILLALFLSIFAADVFTSGYPLWKIPFALFMHLIPSILLIIILILSWKWEWIGGILYIALGISYISKMKNLRADVFFIIPLPLFLIGLLFLIGWFVKKRLIAADSDSYK